MVRDEALRMLVDTDFVRAVQMIAARRLIVALLLPAAIGVVWRAMAVLAPTHVVIVTLDTTRADRIGASLTIVTAPRAGTEVVLAWEPPQFSIPRNVAHAD